MSAPPLLVFTDLDGTLLDHQTYSYQPAAPMLAKLRRFGVPVVFTTSKTAAEVLALRDELQNEDPFIVENGAAAYLPVAQFPAPSEPLERDTTGRYWRKAWSQPRAHWQQLIDQLRPDFDGHFATYQDGGLEQIMRWTGLSREAAKRSASREFGEPVRWTGDRQTAQEFSSRLVSAGANVLEGGRFLHVSGRCDKGLALRWMRDQYLELHSVKDIPTLAAGDSPNDVRMLEAADYAVIVKSPAHLAPHLQPHPGGSERRMLTDSTGPQGWAEGLAKFADPLLL